MSAAPRSQPPKLPVWRTAFEPYRLTLANIGALGALAWAWLLVLLVVSAGLYWSFWPSEMAAREAGGGGSSTLFLAMLAVSSLAGAAVAVGWHRFLLLGEDVVDQPSLRMDARVWRYLAALVGLTVPLVVPVVMLEALEGVSENVSEAETDRLMLAWIACVSVWLVLLPLLNRLMLILPAIAVEPEPPSLAAVWSRTRRNTWRLLLGTLLTLLPPILISSALVMAEIKVDGSEGRIVYTLHSTLSEVAAFLVGMVSVTFLTVAYRVLWPFPPAPPVSR